MLAEQIFFSYSRKDVTLALRLAEDLRNAGINIWIDQIDIPPGAPWDEEIQKALEQSDCLLLILSKTSVASDNVLNEVNYALEMKKQVLPILIDSGINKPFTIRRLQHIDFTGSYEDGLNRLLRSRKVQGNKVSKMVKAKSGHESLPGTIDGKWSTSQLTNPFDPNDTYHLVFNLEEMGDKLIGTLEMLSTNNRYDQKKGLLDGKIKDGAISFYTAEQSIVGTDTVSFRNIYSGLVSNEEIKFYLESDRPWGFPGQKFVARREV